MRYPAILLFLLCLVQHGYGQVLTKEGILQDLDEYHDGIVRNHVDPFTEISRKEFSKKIQQIKDSAGKYDADQVLTAMLQLNADIQDEHTNILYEGRDVFPLYCYWFEEGIYIIRAEAKNEALVYAKVIAVNDVPIDSVVKLITTLCPDKNLPSIKKAVERYLFDPFIIHGLRISPARNAAVYTLVTDKNDTMRVKPEPEDRRTIRQPREAGEHMFRNSRKKPYWYDFIDSNRCVYFMYATCFENKEYPFKPLREALMNDIYEKKPNKIIIDLRYNGGGHPNMLMPFIKELNASALNRKGKIYVLIGRRTFSAALLNAVSLRNLTYAQLVGEETSGNVVHFGAVKFFNLSHTGLQVMYSTQRVNTGEDYDGSLRPDVTVPERLVDFKNGVDKGLEYALGR